MNLLQHLDKLKKKNERLEIRRRQSFDKIFYLSKEMENLGGDILTCSKEIIAACLKNDVGVASNRLRTAEENMKKFNGKLFRCRGILGNLLTNTQLKANDLQNVYSKLESFEKDFSSAKEEFFEAKILYFYIEEGKILRPADLFLSDFETYAGALSDFCGELLRKARLDFTKDSTSTMKSIKRYYDITQDIHQALLSFAFSNKSGIRPKIGHLEGYIRGFEDLFYDFSNKSNKKGIR